MEILKAIILGIVQGITEWLPISSTGHLILVDEFLKMNFPVKFNNVFMVVIQFGSILAVLTLYFNKLNPFSPKKTKNEKQATWNMWFKVIVGVLPAVFIGLPFDSLIDKFPVLYGPVVVSIALIVYGVLFIVIENQRKTPKIHSINELSYKTALYIGLFQTLALIPGTSRSGSTILGAVILGCSRSVAAEFSFFIAIPVMFGASLLKLIKYGLAFTGIQVIVLLTGIVVAYLVSLVAIKFLMSYIKKHDFKAFGWYRIVLGIIVLMYFLIF